MTATLTPAQTEWMVPHRTVQAETQNSGGSVLRRLQTSVYPWLLIIAGFQMFDALRVKEVPTPFEDEGLYIYIGHKMIQHYLHGHFVTDYPGSYFSGAPAFYPVLAAIGDFFDGLNGARDVSLIFAIIAMVGVCGIGKQLFDSKVAGVVGAAVFSINGNIIFLSHFATYDSCMLAFVTLATWLALWSVKHNIMLWSPVVAFLLMAAFMAKYGGAIYTPVVGLLVIAVGWPKYRWFAVRQGVTLVILTAAASLAVLGLVGRSMYQGIEYTTLERHTFSYLSAPAMLNEAYHWVGPWMIAAAICLVIVVAVGKLTPAVAAAMALASIVVIAQQIRIHEAVSYSKHVSFGLAFASPIIGGAFALAIARREWIARVLGSIALVAFAAYYLYPTGQMSARQNMTFWPNDTALVPVVRQYYADFPTLHVLGESPSPERYELEYDIPERFWNTTYALSYHRVPGVAPEHGAKAYHDAVLDHFFGVIYLTSQTNFGAEVQGLINQGHTGYKLRAKVARTIRGRPAGTWLVYTLPLSGDTR